MSYLGIMSRGYICPIVPPEIVQIGGGPTITGAVVLSPQIDGASLGPQVSPPTIQGASELTPTVQGASADPAPVPTDPPTITSGSLLVPIIQSGEED